MPLHNIVEIVQYFTAVELYLRGLSLCPVLLGVLAFVVLLLGPGVLKKKKNGRARRRKCS